jgi:hypothetical protein
MYDVVVVVVVVVVPVLHKHSIQSKIYHLFSFLLLLLYSEKQASKQGRKEGRKEASKQASMILAESFVPTIHSVLVNFESNGWFSVISNPWMGRLCQTFD